MIIDDLSSPFPATTAGTQWQLLSDSVMGGVSTGSMTYGVLRGRPAVRMTGNVSLDNNGGFLQIAMDLAPSGGSVDASGYTGLALDVLGNAEEYGVHLRTPALMRPWQSYRQSFVATPDWRELRLPFAGFVPHRTDVPIGVHHIRRLGLVAIGRVFHADLSIGGVRLY